MILTAQTGSRATIASAVSVLLLVNGNTRQASLRHTGTIMSYNPKKYWDKRAFSYLRFEPFRVARELLLSPLRIRLID